MFIIYGCFAKQNDEEKVPEFEGISRNDTKKSEAEQSLNGNHPSSYYSPGFPENYSRDRKFHEHVFDKAIGLRRLPSGTSN
jgi:hypothetical protein